MKDNFAGVRTGRANAMVLDRIKVDYYGVPTPVNQMARRCPCTATWPWHPSRSGRG